MASQSALLDRLLSTRGGRKAIVLTYQADQARLRYETGLGLVEPAGSAASPEQMREATKPLAAGTMEVLASGMRRLLAVPQSNDPSDADLDLSSEFEALRDGAINAIARELRSTSREEADRHYVALSAELSSMQPDERSILFPALKTQMPASFFIDF